MCHTIKHPLHRHSGASDANGTRACAVVRKNGMTASTVVHANGTTSGPGGVLGPPVCMHTPLCPYARGRWEGEGGHMRVCDGVFELVCVFCAGPSVCLWACDVCAFLVSPAPYVQTIYPITLFTVPHARTLPPCPLHADTLITLFTVPTVVTCRAEQSPAALKRLGRPPDLLVQASNLRCVQDLHRGWRAAEGQAGRPGGGAARAGGAVSPGTGEPGGCSLVRDPMDSEEAGACSLQNGAPYHRRAT